MKKQKKLKKVALTIITVLMIAGFMWGLKQSNSIADVGSFQSYSSGSSSSSGHSSYSSGSSSYSSGGSGYSSGSSYSSRRSSSDDDDSESILWLLLFLFNPNIPWIVKVIVLIIFFTIGGGIFKSRRNRMNRYEPQPYNENIKSEADIVAEIQQKDPKFNPDQFKAFAKDVFIKLQNAWTERDWEKIRNFESNELFEQHKAQLQGYIDNNQINVMERICVNWVKIVSYSKQGNNEILEVDLNSRMGDYIIDATTRELVKGDKNSEYVNVYRLKFTRTAGVKTEEGGQKVNITNCPNCGAPTKIMTSGRCEYCNSVITTKDYGWVLSGLERHGNL